MSARRQIRGDRDGFEAWPVDCGAEVLSPLCRNETLRVHTSSGIFVVHVDRRGVESWPNGLLALLSVYQSGARAALAPRRLPNLRLRKIYPHLLARDGPRCFYCDRPVPRPGADVPTGFACTAEHLVPKTHGGPDHLSNLFLAHEGCNQIAGSLSAPEKIRLRDAMRDKARREAEHHG